MFSASHVGTVSSWSFPASSGNHDQATQSRGPVRIQIWGSCFAVVFVHRFGSYLNPHIHYHVLVTDGVFSAARDNEAEFHPALNLDDDDFHAGQMKMRKRGLRWLHRHGHLDDLAVHTMDSADH
ncbi:MAG: hypothetical protein GY927_09090 [bacterium]|nr:hypothetical protein [bacterium]